MRTALVAVFLLGFGQHLEAGFRFEFISEDDGVLAYLDLPRFPATHEDVRGLYLTQSANEIFGVPLGEYERPLTVTYDPFVRADGGLDGSMANDETFYDWPPVPRVIFFRLWGHAISQVNLDWSTIYRYGVWNKLIAGDANMDGFVDVLDLNILGMNWQQEVSGGFGPWASGDFTGDGFVAVEDLDALAINWQSRVVSVSVPEPTALSLAMAILACNAAIRRFNSRISKRIP